MLVLAPLGSLSAIEIAALAAILGLRIAVVAWIYRDAHRRNRHAWRWAAFAFLALVPTLIVYAIVRQPAGLKGHRLTT